MKIRYYLALAATIGLVATSCSNSTETAIENYIKTGDGVTADISVKFKGTKEIKKVTVGDSISYITKAAELGLKQQIEVSEAEKAKYQADIVNTKNQILVDAYTEAIVKTQRTIDSLKAIVPAPVGQYEGKKTEEILAIIVEATYTATSPEAEVETTTNFVLSPDSKTCYGTTLNPEMDPAK